MASETLEPPSGRRTRSPGWTRWKSPRRSRSDRAPSHLVLDLAEAGRDGDRAAGGRPSSGPVGSPDRASCPARCGRLRELGRNVQTSRVLGRTGHHRRRAVLGFAAALAIGMLIGLAVVRSRILRAAIGSMITALQTMPSIAWFPLSILLFQLSETADPLRGRAGCRSVDRQRRDPRRRLRPAAADAGRPQHRRPGHQPVPLRDRTRRAAGDRGRAQAGLGVRLAEPDGR